MNTVTLTLPYPPSVNTYWRHPSSGKLAGRHLISQSGRNYRNAIYALVKSSHPGIRLVGSLTIAIDAYPPDKRRRDLDNILKALLDSLTHSGIIEDDCQFNRISITRQDIVPGGSIVLTITTQENKL